MVYFILFKKVSNISKILNAFVSSVLTLWLNALQLMLEPSGLMFAMEARKGLEFQWASEGQVLHFFPFKMTF